MTQMEKGVMRERCGTCIYYEHDNWYPDEMVCNCPQSRRYDQNANKDDHCEWWKEQEGK